ncbi:MAG TPA: DUF2500 domain-containing protein [Clostridiales bacterium]|nr:DUF2500 domain-containing protein [Clostridiales bacterium]
MFGLFEVIFALGFAVVLGMMVVTAVRGIGEWNTNNHSPRLTVQAAVVTKRTSVSHTQHPVGGDVSGAHGFHTTNSTSYFVTFQVESGDRMELRVTGQEYGMLAEGDRGMLHIQGTRYLGFDRRQ